MTAPVLLCTITCPECGHAREEEMPTDACTYFYECTRCHTLLKPKPGDCCVFCAYGSVACPPQQQLQQPCHCPGGPTP
ncbi:MAG: GDCCVxC domain-containing (seleno)protein [Gammaproteobacteria bacterium]